MKDGAISLDRQGGVTGRYGELVCIECGEELNFDREPRGHLRLL